MSKAPESEKEVAGPPDARPMCGLVMPIAAIGAYEEHHWTAVEAILREALGDAGFDAKLVSQETTSGIIHQRIITNLYTNPLVVCDVSARNPNVMFELGMRLAFDKPTIIVKDDDTPFSFDISAIEHVQYPKSLKYAEIVDFKEKLAEKVLATAKAAKEDPGYSTFLKHLSGIKPARMNVQEVPYQDFIAKQLDDIRAQLNSMQSRPPPPWPTSGTVAVGEARRMQGDIKVRLQGSIGLSKAEAVASELDALPGILVITRDVGGKYAEFDLHTSGKNSREFVSRIQEILDRHQISDAKIILMR